MIEKLRIAVIYLSPFCVFLIVEYIMLASYTSSEKCPVQWSVREDWKASSEYVFVMLIDNGNDDDEEKSDVKTRGHTT